MDFFLIIIIEPMLVCYFSFTCVLRQSFTEREREREREREVVYGCMDALACVYVIGLLVFFSLLIDE